VNLLRFAVDARRLFVRFFVVVGNFRRLARRQWRAGQQPPPNVFQVSISSAGTIGHELNMGASLAERQAD